MSTHGRSMQARTAGRHHRLRAGVRAEEVADEDGWPRPASRSARSGMRRGPPRVEGRRERLVHRTRVGLSSMRSSSPTRTSAGDVICRRSSIVRSGFRSRPGCQPSRRPRRSVRRRRANAQRTRGSEHGEHGRVGRDIERPNTLEVEVRTDQHQATDKIRSAQGYEEGHDPAIAPTDQVGRAAHDRLEHANRLGRHVVVMERYIGIARSSVSTTIECNNPMLLAKRSTDRVQQLIAIREATVQRKNCVRIVALFTKSARSTSDDRRCQRRRP